MALPNLELLYPQMRFIHVIRDGRDGAVSGWAAVRARGEEGKFASFAEYAGYFAQRHWLPYITRAREAAPGLGDRYLEVRYERLHAEPHAETRRVLEFLGVDSSAPVVDECVEAASFETLSGGRRRGEENQASHFRKGIIGDWENHFDEEALARFDAVARPLLRELGYSRHETSAVSHGP